MKEGWEWAINLDASCQDSELVSPTQAINARLMG